jgi:alanyl-tRNA synthetase
MAWTIQQIERTFLGYMEAHGHAVIEGHSVRSPTDDVLFTTAACTPSSRTCAVSSPTLPGAG